MTRSQKIKLLNGVLTGQTSLDQFMENFPELPPIVIQISPGVYHNGITEDDLQKYKGRVVKIILPQKKEIPK